jgi:hypothetical protein
MLELILGFILIAHGMIHLIGFKKAFHSGSYQVNSIEISSEITKPLGIAWLIVTLLFITSAFLLFLENDHWWFPALTANLFSQALISKAWDEAWPGTVVNIIILAAILILK